MENNLFFGQNLRFLRLQRKLTVNEIADEMGFGRSQWSNYERNNSFPKFLDLIIIAKYFDISETDLIHSDLENSPKTEITKHNSDENQKLLENLTYTVELQKKYILVLENKIEVQKIYDLSDKAITMVAEPSQLK